VKVVAQYAVLGPYDFVTIIEAPDNMSVGRASTELASRGTVRIETLPAIPIALPLTGRQSRATIGQNRSVPRRISRAVAEPAAREATYEDLLQAPHGLVAEILYGRLHTHPRPAPRHARSSSALGGKLFDPFDGGEGGPGGWWILDEPEIHLGRHVVVPDLAGWRRERMPAIPDTAWFELAPDWACEVLSPSTAQTDRSVKLPLYAEQGVGHIWILDPGLRTLEAYALKDGKWLLLATLKEDEPVRLPPFEAVEFSLAVLWA
jgi:Uma2 family endonuclease